jgi:hypothetical protein
MAILDFQYISKNSKKENRRPSRQHSYNVGFPSAKRFLERRIFSIVVNQKIYPLIGSDSHLELLICSKDKISKRIIPAKFVSVV